MALGVIQHAKLDLFWSREASTVRGICGGIKELVRCARASGRRVTLEDTTPWEVGEDGVMGIAIVILDKSINPGQNSDAYMQFDTCRKLGSVAANVYATNIQSSDLIYSLKITKGLYHLHEGTKHTIFRNDDKGNA